MCSLQAEAEVQLDQRIQTLNNLKQNFKHLQYEDIYTILSEDNWSIDQKPNVIKMIEKSVDELISLSANTALDELEHAHVQKVEEIALIDKQIQEVKKQQSQLIQDLFTLEDQLEITLSNAISVQNVHEHLMNYQQDLFKNMLGLSEGLSKSQLPVNYNKFDVTDPLNQFLFNHRLPAVQESQIRSSLFFHTMSQFNKSDNKQQNIEIDVEDKMEDIVVDAMTPNQHVFFNSTASGGGDSKDKKINLDF